MTTPGLGCIKHKQSGIYPKLLHTVLKWPTQHPAIGSRCLLRTYWKWCGLSTNHTDNAPWSCFQMLSLKICTLIEENKKSGILMKIRKAKNDFVLYFAINICVEQKCCSVEIPQENARVTRIVNNWSWSPGPHPRPLFPTLSLPQDIFYFPPLWVILSRHSAHFSQSWGFHNFPFTF